jgi:hypothetical protein
MTCSLKDSNVAGKTAPSPTSTSGRKTLKKEAEDY